jgi:hypothetical protein
VLAAIADSALAPVPPLIATVAGALERSSYPVAPLRRITIVPDGGADGDGLSDVEAEEFVEQREGEGDVALFLGVGLACGHDAGGGHLVGDGP